MIVLNFLGDLIIFMFCKELTHGDFIFSKKDLITDTRRPGVCGSDFLVFFFFVFFFFHSSCFLLTTLKVFGLNCFCVLLFVPMFS